MIKACQVKCKLSKRSSNMRQRKYFLSMQNYQCTVNKSMFVNDANFTIKIIINMNEVTLFANLSFLFLTKFY